MKLNTTLGLVIATFIIGLLAGREFFPKQVDAGAAQSEAAGDTKPGKKKLFGDRPRPSNGKGGGEKGGNEDTAPAASVASVAGVLEQVDPQDQFATANRLRDALGGLGADELESLLVGMEDVSLSDPRFYTARTAIFNYFAAANPKRAFEFTNGHENQQFRSAFIGMAVRALAQTDLAAAREALDQIEDKNLRRSAKGMIVSAAVRSDPGTVAQLLDEMDETTMAYQHYMSPYGYLSYGGGPFGSYYGGYSLMQSDTSGMIGQWADHDPAAAEAYAYKIKNAGKRSAALGSIAQARARKDPEGALAWARGLKKSDGQQNAILGVVSVMAQQDPARVAGMIDEFGSAQQRSSVIATVATQWFQRDSEATMTWLESLPSSQARAQAYNGLMYQLAQKDARGAAELMEKVPVNSRDHAIGTIASSWAAQDLDAARAWVTGLGNTNEQRTALNSMFGVWAKEQPQSAVEFLQNTEGKNIPNVAHLHTTLSSHWAAEDQEAARAWASAIEEDDKRRAAFTGIFNTWASSSPEETAAYLAQVDDPIEREALVSSLSSQWASSNPEAALQWFDQLDAEDRGKVGGSVAQTLAYSAPEQAAALYDRIIADAADDEKKLISLNSNATNIASQWAQHDPAAAAAWAEQLEQETARKEAVGRVAATWLHFDPNGASEWLREMQPGEVRDNAAEQLVNQISHVDPEAAFGWAASISDPQERYRSVQRVVHQWVHRDKESAKAAVAELTDLTAEQREQLNRRLK